MMQRIKNVRWATQGIAAVLLFGMAFVAGGAEQMMRALPASTAAQPIAAPTAIVAPAGIAPVAQPGGSPTKPLSQGPAPMPGPVATKPGSASVPTPYPDIIADGGGITIDNKFVAFNGSIAINSTTIMSSSPGATACRYTGSFTLKNVGGGSPSSVGVNSFDVNTTVEQPQVGKIGSEGYGIPDLKPGATYPQTFYYDLKPGSYVIWLTIDPYHKLKQATLGVKQYHVQLNVSCGRDGSMQRMPGPAKSKGDGPVNPGGPVNGAAPENPGSTKMLNPQPFPPKQGKTGGVELPAVQLPAVQK